MRDHNKLRAFQLADDLAVAVYRLTASFPDTERYGLTSHIRRAAVSTPSNIVERCARWTQADYLHFLDIAYGSSCELQYQLSLAHRLGFTEQASFQETFRLAVENSRVLGGLIRSLRHPPNASQENL